MGTKYRSKRGALAEIDEADRFNGIPAPISDLPSEMLIESLREDRISLRKKQSQAGIMALVGYLRLIEEDQLDGQLALEGMEALTKYREHLESLEDELASRETEVAF